MRLFGYGVLLAALLLPGAVAADVSFIQTVGSAPSADGQPLALAPILADADCAVLPCRPAGTASTLANDGSTVTLAVPHSPYVNRAGTIVLYPGEALAIDFPAPASAPPGPPHFFSQIVGGKAVNTAPMPTPILAVSFGTFHFVTGHEMMSLQINSNFPDAVEYDLTTTQSGSGGLVAKGTFTCVHLANDTGNLIVHGTPGPVLLGNFRVSPNAAKFKDAIPDPKLVQCRPAAAPPG